MEYCLGEKYHVDVILLLARKTTSMALKLYLCFLYEDKYIRSFVGYNVARPFECLL